MESADYDILCKVVIVGDAGTGKSNITTRFTQDSFTDSYISTIGVDFSIKTLDIDGKVVKAQIWDLSGQDRFQIITTSYYRGSHGVMIVFDVTCRESFDRVNYYLKNVQYYADAGIQVMLVGNKTDRTQERQVTSQEGKTLAAENGILYIETSAKTSTNVDRAFVDLITEIIKKYNKTADTSPVPVNNMDTLAPAILNVTEEQSVASIPDQTVPEWGMEMAHALQEVVKKMDAVERLETVVTNMSKRLESVESRLARFEPRKINFKTAHSKSIKP